VFNMSKCICGVSAFGTWHMILVHSNGFMTDILNKATVLVLNRNWQAINVRTPADAFCQMATTSHGARHRSARFAASGDVGRVDQVAEFVGRTTASARPHG